MGGTMVLYLHCKQEQITKVLINVYGRWRWPCGLCDELITHSEEYCRLCGSVCDLETSTMRPPTPELGCCATEKEKYSYMQ